MNRGVDTVEEANSAAECSSAQEMFQTVVSSAGPNAFYRHQKMDEPDLTEEEKMDILQGLFESKPAVFLERYQRWIEPSRPPNSLTQSHNSQPCSRFHLPLQPSSPG